MPHGHIIYNQKVVVFHTLRVFIIKSMFLWAKREMRLGNEG
jgi:hypothetical protein